MPIGRIIKWLIVIVIGNIVIVAILGTIFNNDGQYNNCVRKVTQGQPYYWHGYDLSADSIPQSYGAAQIACQPVSNG